MRYILFVYWLICSFSIQAQHQINTTYRWSTVEYFCADLVCIEQHVEYYIIGDTIIHAEEFNKVQKEGYQLFYYNTSPSDTVYATIYEYAGAIRSEESVWYWVDPIADDERLLFDFNIQDGDSLQLAPNSAIKYELTLVDSFLINDQYHKAYQIGDYAIFQLIEGIGYNTGLTTNLNSIIQYFPERIEYLRCFSKDNAEIGPTEELYETYLNFDFPSSCEIDIINKANEIPLEHISIYPNPVTDLLTVDSPNIISTAIIYDLYGNEIKSFNNLPNYSQIDLSCLTSNIYLLLLKSQGQNHLKKIIKL